MTAPCPACKNPLTISQSNTTPIEAKRPSAPETNSELVPPSSPDFVYTPLRTLSLKNNCARCGREFRGDWDRHQSSLGLICNICSNLVRQQSNTQSTGYVAPIDSMQLEPQIDPVPYKPVEVEEVELTWREKYIPGEDMMRRVAIGGAVAFTLYTVWLIISGAWIVEPAPEDATNAVVATAQVTETLPRWAGWLIKILGTVSGFVSTMIGLYIFLMMGRRLPADTPLANVIQLLPVTAILSGLFLVASILSSLAVPFVAVLLIGVLVYLILVPAIIFITFGFEAQDIINYPVGMLLGGALQSLCYLLIYWAISIVAL